MGRKPAGRSLSNGMWKRCPSCREEREILCKFLGAVCENPFIVICDGVRVDL